MSDPRPQELIHAEELRFNGKVEESLEIILNYEQKPEITPEERLWALLLRGWVYAAKQQIHKAIELGKRTYTLSYELGLVTEAIEALLLRAYSVFLGKTKEADNFILEAEKLVSTLPDIPPYNYSKIVELRLIFKSWFYYFKNEYNSALDFAEEGLTLAEKMGRKLHKGLYLQVMSNIYATKGEKEKIKDFSWKYLEFMKNLDFQSGIADGLLGIGQYVYFNMGNLNKALEYIQKSLSIEGVSKWIKARSFYVLGEIYRIKGFLDISLEHYKQALELAMKASHSIFIGASFIGIGHIYRQKGELDQAKKYFKQGLTHYKEFDYSIGVTASALYLLLIHLDRNTQDQANSYISLLKKYADQTKNKYIQQPYQLAKAFTLRATSRMRDNAEAERLLKQIVDENIYYPEYYLLALISLCDLYLEELSIYNNQAVLEELNYILSKLLDVAQSQNSILWLAEVTLIQAKLALIQLDLDLAKILLTQAQQIAEEHGLELLAQKISSEHDILLEKIDEWDRLNKEDAPMVDRIELASFDGVIDRLQGKQAVDPPKVIDEEPILLLIMDNTGATYFNHPFITNWDHSDLFSSFMSAFNTFMDEIFSKSIDRIRIGENTILINPVESFSACYVIKGQSYPALQKLTQFTKAIRENMEIWEALNNSVKTSEMLELNKPSALKTVINEIFAQ
ncbi:MAG: tetratricopeptide repeat protein [Promethearchaeota archaeon]|jgi:tetratricopeptide (TPR) repeat protein